MNKAELIESIANKANASKAATAVLLNATLEVLSEALARGDNVQLIGFGTFSVSERSARTGRNPQTGKEIKIAAKKVARFAAINRQGKRLGGRCRACCRPRQFS